MTNIDLTIREAAFAAEVKTAYAQKGRPLSDDTVVQVAKGLSLAVGCRTEDVAEVFRIAKATDDIPTQRVLMDATAELSRRRSAENRRRLGPRPGDTLLSDYLARRGMTFNEWLASGFGAAEAYT